MKKGLGLALAGGLLFLAPLRAPAADAAGLLDRIRAVRNEGSGNVDAQKAWRELVGLGAEALLPTLAALDGADATAANWIRAAVDAIAERQLQAGHKLPADRLEAFVKETRHNPAGRRLAYEWLARVDRGAPDRLLPGMLHDPSVELRRDAVAVVLKDAQQHLDGGQKDAARAAFKKALSGARDRDQVELIAQKLKALGAPVDLAAHFGYIQTWYILGPLDSTGGKGYHTPYPPETKVDLAAVSKGKGGEEVRWKLYTTPDVYGMVDLNKAIDKVKGAAAYACAIVESPREQEVELRTMTKNAVKVFCNGRPLYAKEEYHHGKYMDQHVARATLKPGRNTILVKVCQNEQTESWTVEWDFHLRVCDAVGTGIPLKLVTFSPSPEDKEQR
jgi:hypothetical protein